MDPAFVCLFFARSLCRKGTCCLLPHREGDKKLRTCAQSFSEPPSGCPASSGKLRQRGQTLLVVCPAANSVGPSLRICHVILFICFVCMFLRYLCMCVGCDTKIECRALCVLSECPAEKFHPQHQTFSFSSIVYSQTSQLRQQGCEITQPTADQIKNDHN